MSEHEDTRGGSWHIIFGTSTMHDISERRTLAHELHITTSRITVDAVNQAVPQDHSNIELSRAIGSITTLRSKAAILAQ